MLKVFLRHAWRSLRRDRIYTSVSILGLAVGMAVTLLVTLWAWQEYSFDSFHKNGDRIFRVTQSDKTVTGHVDVRAVTGPPLAEALREEIGGIEATVRFYRTDGLIQSDRATLPEQTLYFADPNLFDVFSFSLAIGNPRDALSRPSTIVLSKPAAMRLFGDDTPIGKTVTFNGNHTFEVTGILDDIPQNSHLRFDYLASYSSLGGIFPNLPTYWDGPGWTYILLAPHVTVSQVEPQLPDVIKKYRGPELASVVWLGLQPLRSIHLNSFLGGELEPKTDPDTLFMFMAAAMLILVLAILNHNNLTTARAAARVKELAVRRVLGSNRKQLFVQWTCESLIIVVIASLLALVVAELLRPPFTRIISAALPTDLVSNGVTWFLLGTLAVVTMLITSIYPAHYALTFKTAALLRYDRSMTSVRSWMRRSLVVIQFAAGIALVLCASIAYRQVSYLQYQELGFDPDNVVVVKLQSDQLARSVPMMKSNLSRVPGVIDVSASSHLPGGQDCYGVSFEDPETGESQLIQFFDVDPSFASCMNLGAIEMDSTSVRDATSARTCLISESAAGKFQKPPAVGSLLNLVAKRGDQSVPMGQVRVAGIVKDFHARNLFYREHPMVLIFNSRYLEYLLIRVDKTRTKRTLAAISDAWSLIEPDQPFVYTFLREDLNAMYRGQARFAELLGYASVIAVVLACIGLLSLGSFMLARRTREIGVRKALGATTLMVARLLSREMILLVITANVIAWPIAYWIMSRWLENYIYRTAAHPAFFLIAGVASVLLAQLVVSYHTFRAASRNPVDALRYE